MKKHIKIIFTVIFVLSIFINSGFSASAAINVPEKIRIGLYFTDKASGINTAVFSFNVNAAKGLTINSLEDGKLVLLFEETTNNIVTIRKDSFFINTNGVLTEYTPGKEPAKQGEKIGPYHVRIGGDYKDAKAARAQADALKKKGIDAYVAYADCWQVWTGFFTDEATAEKYMAETLKPALGNGDTTVSTVSQSSKSIVVQNSKGEAAMVYCSSKGVLQIQPRTENDPYSLTINNTNSYRGDLEVRRLQDSDMTVTNVLPLEQYLYGVVPAEIQASSHPEALKAQAVAARTYTLSSLNRHETLGFDLCSTTHCQVYKGLSTEDARSNKAVDDTAGKKVLYKGSLAEVFYFSSSGGRTEDSKNVWGGDVPYLKSVEDKYESGDSWKYNWEVTMTSQQVKDRMLQLGYDTGDILNIVITQYSEAGRAIEMVVRGTKGEAVFTKAKCRSAFSLDSQLFTITTDAGVSVKGAGKTSPKVQLSGSKVMTANGLKTMGAGSGSGLMVIGADNKLKPITAVPTTYTFTGKGWGHGVGMSQEGAKGMAEAGFTYDEILKHYFTGVDVE